MHKFYVTTSDGNRGEIMADYFRAEGPAVLFYLDDKNAPVAMIFSPISVIKARETARRKK